MNKKALVISGGGSKGAFAGGLSEKFIEEGEDFDLYVGTSTGNLLCPLLAIKRPDTLKEAYTSVSNSDIWDINPFKSGGDTASFNYFNIVRSLIKGNYHLGDAGGLKRLIKKFMTRQVYKTIRDKEKKDVVSCVTNQSKSKPEYKSINDHSYEEFVNWMYASSCVPPFMEALRKNNNNYIDGGVTEHAPIQYAINQGVDEVTAIVLKDRSRKEDTKKFKNPLDYLSRTIGTMMREIARNDFSMRKLNAVDKPVKVKIYFLPEELTNNSLDFDQTDMETWWSFGKHVYDDQVHTEEAVIEP